MHLACPPLIALFVTCPADLIRPRIGFAKSMLGEEIGLHHALAEAAIGRIETDPAEHIIQSSGERPSHIIWPAMHKTREQISVLFRISHRLPHGEDTIAAMAESARHHIVVVPTVVPYLEDAMLARTRARITAAHTAPLPPCRPTGPTDRCRSGHFYAIGCGQGRFERPRPALWESS